MSAACDRRPNSSRLYRLLWHSLENLHAFLVAAAGVLLCLALLVAAPVRAALTIEIVGSGERQIPIAIAPLGLSSSRATAGRRFPNVAACSSLRAA